MTGKHYRASANWQRLADGSLKHKSGLVVYQDGDLGWTTDTSTMLAFSEHESARGVPLHDQLTRAQRLLREAIQWHDRNP